MGAPFWLIVVGLVLVAAGLLIRWWSGRYDLKGAAFDSAWTLARGRRTPDNPTAIEAVLKDIRRQPTWKARAARTAGTALGHWAAQILGLVSLAIIAAGTLLTAIGVIWSLYSG